MIGKNVYLNYPESSFYHGRKGIIDSEPDDRDTYMVKVECHGTTAINSKTFVDADEYVRLYHGTCSKFLPKILEEGLQPRMITNNSNWDHTVKSKNDLVYLTNSYAIYFALIAADQTNSNPVIIQCFVNKKYLYPDEDFVAQIFHKQNPESDLMKLTESINPKNYDIKTALDSLRLLGTGATEFVIPEMITRIVEIKDHKVLSTIDPTITMINKIIMGEYYEKITDFVIDINPKFPNTRYHINEPISEDQKIALDNYICALNDRTGLIRIK